VLALEFSSMSVLGHKQTLGAVICTTGSLFFMEIQAVPEGRKTPTHSQMLDRDDTPQEDLRGGRRENGENAFLTASVGEFDARPYQSCCDAADASVRQRNASGSKLDFKIWHQHEFTMGALEARLVNGVGLTS
jgi:hypothetical protein